MKWSLIVIPKPNLSSVLPKIQSTAPLCPVLMGCLTDGFNAESNVVVNDKWGHEEHSYVLQIVSPFHLVYYFIVALNLWDELSRQLLHQESAGYTRLHSWDMQPFFFFFSNPSRHVILQSVKVSLKLHCVTNLNAAIPSTGNPGSTPSWLPSRRLSSTRCLHHRRRSGGRGVSAQRRSVQMEKESEPTV